MFESNLQVEQVSKNDWILIRTLRYKSDRFNLIIPAGFKTDLTTWHYEGRWTRASVLHDRMLKLPEFTRNQADSAMREAMRSLNVSYYHYIKITMGLFIGNIKSKMV